MQVKLAITIVNPSESNSIMNHSVVIDRNLAHDHSMKYLRGFKQTNSSSCGTTDPDDPTFAAIYTNGQQIATVICVKDIE